MKTLALSAIAAYKRHLSPRKGFGCAYRIHAGRPSCSALGMRAVRIRGVLGGLALIRRRLARCSEVHREHSSRPAVPRAQSGFCDLPGSACECASDAFDCFDLFTSDSDKKRKPKTANKPKERPQREGAGARLDEWR